MKYTVIILAMLLGGCAGSSVQEQIQASSEGRALERMADNLSNKASSGHCSIIRTGGFWTVGTSTTVSCP